MAGVLRARSEKEARERCNLTQHTDRCSSGRAATVRMLQRIRAAEDVDCSVAYSTSGNVFGSDPTGGD